MMSRARHKRRDQRIAPHAEATAALATDYPQTVKTQLFLLSRGNMVAGKQRCIVCGKRGEFGELWIPSELLAPLPSEHATPQAYWTCRQHHEAPMPDAELVQLLAARRRSPRR
jgi:hypothetical protein